jgi:hypothetical protein
MKATANIENRLKQKTLYTANVEGECFDGLFNPYGNDCLMKETKVQNKLHKYILYFKKFQTVVCVHNLINYGQSKFKQKQRQKQRKSR